MRWLVWLALAACSTSRAAPDSRRATGAVTVLAEARAWDYTAAAGTLVVLDDKFLTLSAVRADTGTAAWQAKLQSAARGRQTLHAAGATVIAWLGDRRHIVDAATGKLLASAPASWNGTAWRDGGCGFEVRDGLCAERCQCSLQLIDCRNGQPIGARFLLQHIERIDPGGKMSSGCWGSNAELIAHAGPLAIASAEDTAKANRHVTVGVDLATGQQVWQRPHGTSPAPFATGATPDRKTCWLTDLSSSMQVADCATGATLWKSEPPPGTTTQRFQVGLAGRDRLFELRDAQATLYDLRSGKPWWSVALPAGTVAWPAGAIPELAYASASSTEVAILDAATGKVRLRIAVPKQATVISDRAGGFYLAGDQLIHYDTSGAVVGRAPFGPEAGFELGDGLMLARTKTATIFLARDDLHELGRLAGESSTAILEGALGKGRVALFRYDGKAIGTVTLVKLGP